MRAGGRLDNLFKVEFLVRLPTVCSLEARQRWAVLEIPFGDWLQDVGAFWAVPNVDSPEARPTLGCVTDPFQGSDAAEKNAFPPYSTFPAPFFLPAPRLHSA